MNEIDTLVARLNKLQGRVYRNRAPLNADEKNEWRETANEIRSNGYVLRRHRGKDGKVRWWAVRSDDTSLRNSECPYIFTDVRPNDGTRTLRGDCTSRAMTFVLQGTMTYRQIESEQYALAAREKSRGRRARRNSNGIWDLVIINRGWVKIALNRALKRSIVGKRLAGKIHAPVISLSCGHVAAIDENGAVRDTWDSRGGRVRAIYARKEDEYAVRVALNGAFLR